MTVWIMCTIPVWLVLEGLKDPRFDEFHKVSCTYTGGVNNLRNTKESQVHNHCRTPHHLIQEGYPLRDGQKHPKRGKSRKL